MSVVAPKGAIFYIGPESKVWHARQDCTALVRRDRYWPIRFCRLGPLQEKVKNERRPCKLCVVEV